MHVSHIRRLKDVSVEPPPEHHEQLDLVQRLVWINYAELRRRERWSGQTALLAAVVYIQTWWRSRMAQRAVLRAIQRELDSFGASAAAATTPTPTPTPDSASVSPVTQPEPDQAKLSRKARLTRLLTRYQARVGGSAAPTPRLPAGGPSSASVRFSESSLDMELADMQRLYSSPSAEPLTPPQSSSISLAFPGQT
jgi:hypothetical protein